MKRFNYLVGGNRTPIVCISSLTPLESSLHHVGTSIFLPISASAGQSGQVSFGVRSASSLHDLVWVGLGVVLALGHALGPTHGHGRSI